jgi:hypothetical protein
MNKPANKVFCNTEVHVWGGKNWPAGHIRNENWPAGHIRNENPLNQACGKILDNKWTVLHLKIRAIKI